jgi:hypothetical protein
MGGAGKKKRIRRKEKMGREEVGSRLGVDAEMAHGAHLSK